ncbi:MAG: HAD family hydrolase [Burkholderiaceae bacterium]
MYSNKERLIIFDADGTIIDAFSAIDEAFSQNGMAIGELENFQKRRNLFKYLGELKEVPFNLKKQLGKKSRKKILSSLTEVYRENALLYPGFAELIKTMIAMPDIRVGLVTRNVTNEPVITIGKLLLRHGIDINDLDYMTHVPLGKDKSSFFRFARKNFDINPARSYACGDEHKDFIAATSAGMHPFIASYGFEDHKRLTKKFDVPEEVISRTPQELCERIRHALDIA